MLETEVLEIKRKLLNDVNESKYYYEDPKVIEIDRQKKRK